MSSSASKNSVISISSYSEKYDNRSSKVNNEYIEDSSKVHKFSPIWLAPLENPLDFEHFKKNFQDYSQDYSCMTNNSSQYKVGKASTSSCSATHKKGVTYA